MEEEYAIMIYPEFIQPGDTIGISAPSQGVGHKIEDFERSVQYLQKKGYRIKETASVRNHSEPSAPAEIRGAELNSLFKDDEVKMVMCAAGGDFLIEMIPHADFAMMKKHPKWLMGASDPTGLLFPYTTKYDVATIYGCNAGSYDIAPLPKYLKNNLEIISGNLITQKTFPKYMKQPPFLADKIEFDTPNKWYGTVSELKTNGRCIGGCIDVLKDIIGTKNDNVKQFIRKYKDDGFIWYLDNFSLNAETFYRTLLQMRYAGWLEYSKAILVGRVCFESSDTGLTYEEAMQKAFPDIPVIYQADIGHTVPSMTMINGAILNLNYKNKKAELTFSLR